MRAMTFLTASFLVSSFKLFKSAFSSCISPGTVNHDVTCLTFLCALKVLGVGRHAAA
jgi:hypothetical protein